MTVRWTIWGPVVGKDFMGRLRASRWVGHAPDRLGGVAHAARASAHAGRSFDAANGAGMPGQNLVLAEQSGRIGWTIFGAIPNRVGFDGRLSVSWADGWRGWNGWLDAGGLPALIDPPGDRIWTANARVVDGRMLERLGDGSYEVGARATMIRDRLRDSESFTPRDMLDIQLDTRALFLARWRDLILEHLSRDVVAGDSARQRFRDVVEKGWTGSGVARLGRVPADAHVPRPGDGSGGLVRSRRVLRSRRRVRLHHSAPARGRRSGSWCASGLRTC